MKINNIFDCALLGYARVSKIEQNLNRKMDMLVKYRVDGRNIYNEKMTGTKADRPELNRMIKEG
jgi:DNA invertase Pin-like site-specific DNA recombinase